jgi:hypothetical protein
VGNGITLYFSEDDLRECTSRYEKDAHTTANHMVEYLRAMERKIPPRGKEELKTLIDNGIISITTFTMFHAALERLDEPYEIRIT